MASRRPGRSGGGPEPGLDVRRRILSGERERLHAILVHRARAEWATRRLLVDEHRSLAERARALAHGKRSIRLFGHKVSHARGERSSPSSDAARTSLNRPGSWTHRGRQETQRGPPMRRASTGGATAVDQVWSEGLGRCPTFALAAWNVRVNRFVLPAVVPFVVDRELRFTTGIRADAALPVALVGPGERSDGSAPEPLL
jgi:hypothetical protein